jgi:hypothetical protein
MFTGAIFASGLYGVHLLRSNDVVCAMCYVLTDKKD